MALRYRFLILGLLALSVARSLGAVPFTSTVTPSVTQTATPSGTPSPTVTTTPDCNAQFGCVTCTALQWGAYFANETKAGRFFLPTNGSISSIEVQLSTTASVLSRVGIYADNGNAPGALLYQSQTFTATIGWNSIAVNAFYLNSGNYWLAVLLPSGLGLFEDTLATANDEQVSVYSSATSLPISISSGINYNDKVYIRANYCPGPPLFYTPTPTATPTPTPRPPFLTSSVGHSAFGPVPAVKGAPVCLYLDQRAQHVSVELFNLAGTRIAALDGDGTQDACWDTSAAAPGLYYANVKVSYADGSEKKFVQKLVVVGR